MALPSLDPLLNLMVPLVADMEEGVIETRDQDNNEVPPPLPWMRNHGHEAVSLNPPHL